MLTVSVGIARFTSGRHLDKGVWDLPLFSPSEAATLAVKLHAALQLQDVDLWDALGVKKVEANAALDLENLGATLEELFGGVPGYTAELLVELSKGNPLSAYTLELSGRVRTIIVKAATARSISDEALSCAWLREMQAADNTWACMRDAGLCGSAAPRGVIFTLMLKWLFKIVRAFRSKFRDDPGLDGNLLELEEILKLDGGTPLPAVLLELLEHKWVAGSSEQLGGIQMCLGKYDEPSSTVEIRGKEKSKWYSIHLQSGFCILDLLLVHYDADHNKLRFFLIQVTRAKEPFAVHDTDETCSQKSKMRIKALLDAATKAIVGSAGDEGEDQEELQHSTSYVMLAPNSEGNKFVAPNHQSPYYFSPPNRVELAGDGKSPRKKKQKKKAACCKCGSKNGDCLKCTCAKSDSKKCTNCGSSNCAAN